MKTTIDIPEKGLSDAIHFTRAKTKLMAYNPYQNGKCEAWWNALERRLMTMLEGVGGAVPKIASRRNAPPLLTPAPVSPTSGAIRLFGTRLDDLPPHRRPVNTVFQHYALFPHMTVAENVGFGLEMLGKDRVESTRIVAETLALVRMTEFTGRNPDQLSGGQQQHTGTRPLHLQKWQRFVSTPRKC